MPASASIATVALSLTSAISWGAGDFSGGIASKKANVFQVVAVAHATGLVFVVALALIRNELFPGHAAIFWGAMAGLAGAVGLTALYRGLAIGKMGIVGPVAAVLTAVLPVVYGSFTQGMPKTLQLIGFLLAAIGIVHISKPEKTEGVPVGLGLALLAGVGFGFFLICINRAGNTSVFWPLIAARSVSLIVMLVLLAFSRKDPASEKKPWVAMMLAGAGDSIGNVLFIFATQYGRLDVAAVLSSLYPASTVVLARIVLHERVSVLQNLGMITALASIPLIAA